MIARSLRLLRLDRRDLAPNFHFPSLSALLLRLRLETAQLLLAPPSGPL
jgi:hypothetical protein